MPHAALWVVQQVYDFSLVLHGYCFNAARGFVGGAAAISTSDLDTLIGFNAARGFVDGATL